MTRIGAYYHMEELANARTVQHGRALAHSGCVTNKHCASKRNRTDLSCTILLDGGAAAYFTANATLDEAERTVTDWFCTCETSFKHPSNPCKHCIALVTSYVDEPQTFSGYVEPAHGNRSSEGVSILLKNAKSSSDGLRLQEGSRESAALFARLAAAEAHEEPEEDGLVMIEPTLLRDRNRWFLKLKLSGPRGSYAVKDINAFSYNLRAKNYVCYGKKLAFTHESARFFEQSARIAEYVVQTAERLAEAKKLLGSATGRSGNTRALVLTEADVVDFLDIMDEMRCSFELEAAQEKRLYPSAHILNENPALSLNVTKDEEAGGYVVFCPDETNVIRKGSQSYVLLDDAFYRCDSSFDSAADFLEVIEASNYELFASEDDMGKLCATVLPKIEGAFSLSLPENLQLSVPAACTLKFFFDCEGKKAVCTAKAVYGNDEFTLTKAKNSDEEKPRGSVMRNSAVERCALRLLREYFPSEDATLRLKDSARLGKLLFEGLPLFNLAGKVYTTAQFDRLISDKRPSIATGLSLGANLINLSISSDDLEPDDLASLLTTYRRKKRFHQQKNGTFLDLENCDLTRLTSLVEELGITADQIASESIQLPAHRAFYLDEELDDAQKDDAFEAYIDKLKHIDPNAYCVPESIRATLREYQLEGFRWMSSLLDMGLGGILADEMGLGKSLQLITLLASRREEAAKVGPSLIVCPASLVYNWVAEFEKFAPSMNVIAVCGSSSERKALRRAACVGRKTAADVLVTSYDLLRIDSEAYKDLPIYCCVLDEAQYIKNHATLTARTTKKIVARHRFALTGTPMENRLSELWSIFDFLMPGFLGTYMSFRENYEIDILGNNSPAAKRLSRIVGPFMMRRLKSDVLKELPEKLESTTYVQMTPEQTKIYRAHEQHLRESLLEQKKEKRDANSGQRQNSVETLAELMKLRQICCDPRLLFDDFPTPGAKLDAIEDLIEQAIDSGEKTLVFSQFTSFLSLIADRLDHRGVKYFTITGSTPKKHRVDLVERFNADDTPVFLVSLKAGGTGLNLTGASIVVHADPWWNAAAQNQATDRAHRIGQSRIVTVVKVVAQNTIEERILELQEAKSELAERILGEESLTLSALTKEELLELLQG